MIYRWERDVESHDRDGGMVLRPDDDGPQDNVSVALYWHDPDAGEWDWMAMDTGGEGVWDWVEMGIGQEGECASADDARRACELAVLHEEETT